MDTDVMDAINKELDNIHLRRHQLIFLVTDDFKEDIRFVSDGLEVPYININLELSKMLQDITIKKRQRIINERDKKIIIDKENDILVLDHIAIVFGRQLHHNPVLLLEDLSRDFKLIVAWSGQCNKQKIIYAEPDHDEYFTQENTEGIIIEYN